MKKFSIKAFAGFVPALLIALFCVSVVAQIGNPEDFENLKTVARTTSWGQSDDVRNDLTFFDPNGNALVDLEEPSRQLTNVLNTVFAGGTYKIFAFDEFTPGFTRGEITLLVAVGGDTVAVMQSGSGSGNACITPTPIFTTTGGTPNVFVFKGGDLALVGPLTYAEVTRSTINEDRGYIYVGGCNGMARLQQVGSDAGWNNQVGLDDNDLNVDFAIDNEFKRIPSFDGHNVVAIQSRDADLVVLTTEEVLHAPSNEDIADTIITRRLPAQYGTDLVMTEGWVIYATTGGVFWTNRNLTAAPQRVLGLTDTPVALAYLSLTKGYQSRTGNLIVMTHDRDNDRGRAYRFFVDNVGIRPVKGSEIVVDWKQLRRDISTDGLTFFSSRIVSTDQSDVLQIFTRDGGINSITNALNVPEGTKYAGRPVRDPASGGWVVPGQSVRVNE